MSSLWSMFLKGKLLLDQDVERARLTQAIDFLTKECPPRLVNIQHIVDAEEGSPLSFNQSWDATPPFRALWLEWISNGQRMAIAVMRLELEEVAPGGPVPRPVNTRFMLLLQPYVEYQGSAVLVNSISVFIDDLGAMNLDRLGSDVDPEKGANMWKLQIVAYVAAEALTTMNTHGTRVEPPFASDTAQPGEKKKRPEKPGPPHSIWHTVHLPRYSVVEESSGDGPGGTGGERREHWVRAYRRDYRKGKGLFGRIHGLVWMPEHKRGNAELGTVKQDYELHKR